MSFLSKLFGSKKTNDVQIEVHESPSESTMQFSEPTTEKVTFDIAPDNLPEAIKFIVDKWGNNYLTNKSFINVLNDFHALKDIPAAKHILQTMLSEGYIDKLLNSSNWELDSSAYTLQFVKDYGTRNDIVSFIVQSLGYGLSRINAKPVFKLAPQPEFRNNEQGVNTNSIKQEKRPDVEINAKDNDTLLPYDPKLDLKYYHYPTLNLLDSEALPIFDKQQADDLKYRVIEILKDMFNFEISAIKLVQGPSVSFFEMVPAKGMRLSTLKGAEEEFSMLLSSKGVRMQLPIYGTGNIGLEVPRIDPQRLTLEQVINTKVFQESTMDLPCAIGKTVDGKVFMFDLAQLPHLLVGGATGQGKSICLHSILLSLLYKKHPAEVKFVLVDFKRIELGCYAALANHFLASYWDNQDDPIVSNTDQADKTFGALLNTYNARFKLLAKSGTRNIKDYNRKFVARQLNPVDGHKYLPYIVVVIDEYYNLINSDRKFLEPIITEFAKKGRAVGIHLVIATNRPTSDIVDNAIKTEIAGKIAFKVSTSSESRLILNTGGAEKLLGEGDMLYTDKTNTLVRVQCTLPSFDDIDRVCDYVSKQQSYLMPYELDIDEPTPEPQNDVDLSCLDPFFEEAAHAIVISQQGSTSLIQRRFSIGYNRAGRLMAQLEKAGIVGPACGSKPRDVLISDENSLYRILQSLQR